MYIVELEDLGLVAVNGEGSDGSRMESWKCDETGYAIDNNEESFYLKPVYKNDLENEENFILIGYEEVL